VDRGYAGKGLGADLLADAPRRIAGASTTIGIAAVLVQAKDEAAKAWYLRQAEFMAFPEDGRVLWLPVEMVVGEMRLRRLQKLAQNRLLNYRWS
jgi:hypothetical protein